MSYLCEWQLDLFNRAPPSEMEDVKRYALTLKGALDNLRKGVFVRLEEINKSLKEHEERLFFLEASLEKARYDLEKIQLIPKGQKKKAERISFPFEFGCDEKK